jgi:site-specific DNA-methyltransferase (adenine-specific)
LNDGGGAGASATPLYNRFIEQAKKLEPRFLCMIVPAKWYSGGKGLNEFRATMLSDKRIRHLTDFPDSRSAFSGVDVAGGVCYFLWDRDNTGDCVVETVTSDGRTTADRSLDEFETFIRDSRAVAIIHKVKSDSERSFADVVSSRKPFGLESADRGDAQGDTYLFAAGGDKRINRVRVPKGHELIDKWKVLLSKTSSEHAGQTDRSGTKRVFSRIEVMPPGSAATESYLVIGPFNSRKQAENAAAYLRTKFVRWLVSTILLTQNISKSMFEFVPGQDFKSIWSDEDLYSKYGLSNDEIALVEGSIRSLDLGNDEAD